MSTLSVKGMRCEHCQKSVTENVQKLANAGEVVVDLAGGKVTWSGTASADDVAKVIDGLGFEVVR